MGLKCYFIYLVYIYDYFVFIVKMKGRGFIEDLFIIFYVFSYKRKGSYDFRNKKKFFRLICKLIEKYF